MVLVLFCLTLRWNEAPHPLKKLFELFRILS